MRLWYKYAISSEGRGPFAAAEQSADGWDSCWASNSKRYASADQFFNARAASRNVAAAQRLYAQFLEKGRKTISIGAGSCICEAPFVRQGYDIVCSDIAGRPPAVSTYCPELSFVKDDILKTEIREEFDDVIINGLLCVFDDGELQLALANMHRLLKPRGRLLFVHRSMDSWLTRLVLDFMIPFELRGALMVRKLLGIVAGRRQEISGLKMLRAHHAYRRSCREMRSILAEAGFSVVREVADGHGGYSRRSRLLRASGIRRVLAFASRHLAPFDSYYYGFVLQKDV